MKWDDLRIFLEVARQGNIHNAAKRLKLHHSTVSRRIDRLEERLGVKLFDRVRDGVVVRAGVEDLLRHAEQMELHASSMEESMPTGVARATQAIRIATMEGLASRYIALRVPLLARIDPTIKIELVSIPQMVDLSRKEADIFLSFFNPNNTGLSSKRVAEFSLYLYCTKAYLRAQGVPRSRCELSKHLFVGYIEDLLQINSVRWLDEAVKSPSYVFHSNSIIAQCAAACADMGIVMLPTFVAAHVPELTRILENEVRVRRDIWMSVRSGQAAIGATRKVIRFLTSVLEVDKGFLMGESMELAPQLKL